MNYQGFFKLNLIKTPPIYIKNDFKIIMFREDVNTHIEFHFVVEGIEDHYYITKEELERVLHYVRTRDNIKDF